MPSYTVSQTQRGGPMLTCKEDNYQYRCEGKNKSGSTLYWICLVHKKFKCSARVHTDADHNHKTSKGEHIHPSTVASTGSSRAMKKMTNEAKEPGQARTAMQIVADNLQGLPDSVLNKMPDEKSIAKKLQSYLSKEHKDIPHSRTGYDIPEQYANIQEYNENGEKWGIYKFLQFDSGKEDEDRMLLFATERGLENLREYKTWACDGTFKSANENWYQLFSVHGVLHKSRSAPCGYVLLPNKKETTYIDLFKCLDTMLGTKPTEVLCDFEKALMNAIKTCFPDAKVSNCNWHFCENIYRKVKNLGYQTEYNTNPEFSHAVNKLKALAFLPCDCVVRGYELLEDEIGHIIPKELFDYFEENYIGELKGRGKNQRRLLPLFLIEHWNVYDRLKNDRPRTNNLVEGFNSGFSKLLGQAKPNLWKLIDNMKKYEGIAKKRVLKFKHGKIPSGKSDYEKLNKKYKNILADFDHKREDNKGDVDDKLIKETLELVADLMH